jgi:O-6-methylguanine DNA methyltransferase
MTVIQYVFSCHTVGPLNDVMAAFPDVQIKGTSFDKLLLLDFQGESDLLCLVENWLREHWNVDEVSRNGERLMITVQTPNSESEYLDWINEKGTYLQPPIEYSKGITKIRLVQFGIKMPDMYEMPPRWKLESKKVLPLDSLENELSGSGLFPSLTRKQSQAIIAAVDAGYYDNPRKVKTSDVALRLGISRSTFEEHLRAAESRIIRSSIPMVKMRSVEQDKKTRSFGTDALQLYAQYSNDLALFVNISIRGEKLTGVELTPGPPQGEYRHDHPYLTRIMDHLSTGRDDLQDIPLDLEVTPFEREVLELLRTIPPGEVRTYGDVAKILGRPKASRAIGNTCAKNPVLIVVPCHRIVPAAGGLGNYAGAGGVETKRALLEKEGMSIRKHQD